MARVKCGKRKIRGFGRIGEGNKMIVETLDHFFIPS